MDVLKKLIDHFRDDELPTETWEQLIRPKVPYVSLLTSAEQDHLRQLGAQFLRHKRFEGAGGQTVDVQVRSVIAAQACLLHLKLEGPLFPTVRTVIVYPGPYRVQSTEQRPEGVQVPLAQVRAGESWDYGTLVLSWRDVIRGAADPADGDNVVLHEFAHQLDEETGETNGAPALPSPERYESWQADFQRAYDRLRMALATGDRTAPLHAYAASTPAEFFAVATEVFFERPHALRAYDPSIYRQLRAFYQQEPVDRFP